MVKLQTPNTFLHKIYAVASDWHDKNKPDLSGVNRKQRSCNEFT